MTLPISGSTPGEPGLTVEQAAAKFDVMFSEEEQGRAVEPQEGAEVEAKAPAQEAESDEDEQPVEPEAEAEAEDVEGEDDADEDAEDVEETKPASEVHKVKVGDQELEVTTDEALKGYMRQADYTRKTQELAAQRKEFAEKELPQVREERAQYAQLLTALKQTLEGMTPKEPDWNALRAQDPEVFADTWARWQLHQQRLAAVAQEEQVALAKKQEDDAKQFEAYVEAQSQAAVEAIPELADPAQGDEVRGKMVEYAKSVGFTPDEIAQVIDHRALVLLRKAQLWDESQKQRPTVHKKVAEVRAVAKPGAKPGGVTARPREVSDLTRAKQRLAKTGNVSDAARAIDLIFENAEKQKRRSR